MMSFLSIKVHGILTYLREVGMCWITVTNEPKFRCLGGEFSPYVTLFGAAFWFWFWLWRKYLACFYPVQAFWSVRCTIVNYEYSVCSKIHLALPLDGLVHLFIHAMFWEYLPCTRCCSRYELCSREQSNYQLFPHGANRMLAEVVIT